MNNALMTPDTAPRDAAQLANQGPFIHRRLGEALAALGFNCWSNEREKSAFVTASPADRAQALLLQLQAYDASKGGAPAPAPQPGPTTAQPGPQPGPAPTTGRQPRTVAGAANGAGAATGNVVELLNALKGVSDKLDAIASKLDASAGAEELDGLKAMVAASLQIQKVEVGLLCLLGENILGAATADFIGDAVTYGTSALQSIDPGKG